MEAGDADLEEAIRTALQDFLAAEGFSDPAAARTGGVILRRGEVMLRFRRPDRQSNEVQVSIGQRRTTDIVDWVRVALLSPQASIAHACWCWELPELPSPTVALERLRDEVLAPHVAAFWRDAGRLPPVFEARDREHDRRLRAGIDEQNLRAARSSFQHGRFQEAERYFAQLDRLSSADQKRRDIAREAAHRDRGRDAGGATSGTPE